MLRALFRGMQAGLCGLQPRAGRNHLAWSRSAGRGQFGERIQIVLRLIACQAILLDLGRRCLLLRLGAVVRGGIERRLRRLHAALSARHLRAGRHVVERDQQLAGRDLIALLRIHRLHRGGDGAVERVIHDRLYAAVGAHGVQQQRVPHLRHADGQPLAQKVSRREKYGNQGRRLYRSKATGGLFAILLQPCI